MAQGKVDAVVVGADRVVANGDTANKIGTYSHAVAAKHHNIPFFIAAPTTTLDAYLAVGDQIEIEQRPAEEITHFKGQRVVVQGIKVWNPCFDVTPGTLIEGIITEKGVVPRDAGTGRHQVAKFIAAQQQQQVNGHAEAGKQHVFQPNRQTLGSTAVHGSNKPTGMMVQVCYVPRMLGWLDTAADRQQNGTVNGSRTAAAGATAVGQ
eukprot:GHRR01030469.1.p1 GENE.GHRR01030469.1~~GHRR01030469.1.p1  ORF type:complete len:207 (+),score=91.56 GHRR01030469.1:534-1154(+)